MHKPTAIAPAAIVNLDDPSAGAFIGTARDAGARVDHLRHGARRGRPRDPHQPRTPPASTPTSRHPSGTATLDLRLAGRFNVHNALAVVALGEALGLDPAAVRAGLAVARAGVPGRMERVDAGQPFGVIVDFAHSPASLRRSSTCSRRPRRPAAAD